MSVAVSNSEKFVVSGSHDKSIRFFDIETKEIIHTFRQAHTGSNIYVSCLYYLK